MGVPKFYRWLSERYPCLSEVVKEHQIPEFDNFYLDMNGIIHLCSHPNDDDPHFRITEEQIFAAIFHYLEVLFRMIQPRKVFFLAVDGVAPRAKMNQQRGRRFRSAREAEANEKRARDRGEELPKEARFDSNCITPGTPFMDRLHHQLQYFITNKVSTDPLWKNVHVILSGHETPGEGEHKVMDYIRHQKAQPGYDPNIRHCLYGLDADLIMLGLCTHDPHFSLLREEVRFGGKKQQASKRTPVPEETTFHLLHLSLLREYIDHEFSDLREKLSFPYDIEAIIDDWVLLGFLVGNDFIPNLPHLHINKGALTELYTTYKTVLPTLGGYVNVSGNLHLERFEKLLKELGLREVERFMEIYSDTKWLEGKTASRTKDGKHSIKPTPGPAAVQDLLEMDVSTNKAANNHKAGSMDDDFSRLLQSAEEFVSEDEDDAKELAFIGPTSGAPSSIFQIEFRHHKRDYYMHKLGYTQVDESVLLEQAETYVRAIQWILHYYYHGCQSWGWYYPHHFAPWITDIQKFLSIKMNFEMGKPFLPFEQLLSVLPAASKELLPKPLQTLMTSALSPIIEYYPTEFECDLNGKQQDWEAVVLIPFIKEELLLSAMKPVLGSLTQEEKTRNAHGPILIYSYQADDLGTFEAPAYFPSVLRNHARLQKVERVEWYVKPEDLKLGLMDGVRLDVFFPGFLTLKHIEHTAFLKTAGVKVFEQASRGENMMLKVEDQGIPDTQQMAKELLGKEIWVSWPHMIEARVEKVADINTMFTEEGRSQNSEASFLAAVTAVKERYYNRWGIDIGETAVLVYATPMTGRKYVCGAKGKITLEKIWSRHAQHFALQTTRKDILVHDPSFTQYRTVEELYPVDSTCFMLGQPYYGAKGQVLQISATHKGRIQLNFRAVSDPDLSQVIQAKEQLSLPYFTAYEASNRLGIRSNIISRITGSIFIIKSPKGTDSDRASRVNVGLNLKFNRRNEEVCDFSRKFRDTWLYSSRALELVEQYMEKFPELFQYLSRHNGGSTTKDCFHIEEVFAPTEEQSPLAQLEELQAWLKSLPSQDAARQPCGTLTLDNTVVAELEKLLDSTKSKYDIKEVTMQVRPHLLFKPDLVEGHSQPDPRAKHFLFDRVVNVREGYSIPFGLKGIITGIHQKSGDTRDEKETLYDVLFDEPFQGGISLRSSQGRSYRMPNSAFINITYGVTCARNKNGENAQGHRSQQGPRQGSKPAANDSPSLMNKQHSTGAKNKALPQRAAPDPTALPDPNTLFAQFKHSDREQAAPRFPGASRTLMPQQPPGLSGSQQQPSSNGNLQQLWNQLTMQSAEANVPHHSNSTRDMAQVTNAFEVNMHLDFRPRESKSLPKVENQFVPLQVRKKIASKSANQDKTMTKSGKDEMPKVGSASPTDITRAKTEKKGRGRGRGGSKLGPPPPISGNANNQEQDRDRRGFQHPSKPSDPGANKEKEQDAVQKSSVQSKEQGYQPVLGPPKTSRPKNQGQSRGHGRGRGKQRIAANFNEQLT